MSSSSALAPSRISFTSPASRTTEQPMARAERSPATGATVRLDRATTQRPSALKDADDATLVAAIARGDRAAMAQLYDRYASLLLGLASRVVGDRVHAEDVLHDALLEAWHRAGEYDPARGSVRAWLVTRVRSRALDEQQGKARRRRLLRNNPDSLTMARFQAPDFRDGDNERVRRTLADLPVELGVVVNLVYYEGLTSTVAGSRLGIPNGTVKSRLARAMTLLRQQLATSAA